MQKSCVANLVSAFSDVIVSEVQLCVRFHCSVSVYRCRCQAASDFGCFDVRADHCATHMTLLVMILFDYNSRSFFLIFSFIKVTTWIHAMSVS